MIWAAGIGRIQTLRHIAKFLGGCYQSYVWGFKLDEGEEPTHRTSIKVLVIDLADYVEIQSAAATQLEAFKCRCGGLSDSCDGLL